MDSIGKRVFVSKRITGRMAILCASLLFCGQASASDGVASELSHAAGGAVLAGGITYLADKSSSYREQRAWIGFGLSSLLFTVVELTLSPDGNTYSNRLDIASHVIGSAVGAFATDKWLLKPVIKQESAGNPYYGVETKLTF